MALAKKTMTSKITKDNTYIDVSKVKPVVNDLNKTLNGMVDTTDKLSTLLKKIVSDHAVTGDIAVPIKKMGNKFGVRRDGLKGRKTQLSNKFNADVQDMTIDGLSNQLRILEDRLRDLETRFNQQEASLNQQ